MCLIRVGTPSALFTALSPAPYPQHPSQDIYISCIYIYIRRKEAWKEKMFLVSHFLSDLRRSASMAFSLGSHFAGFSLSPLPFQFTLPLQEHSEFLSLLLFFFISFLVFFLLSLFSCLCFFLFSSLLYYYFFYSCIILFLQIRELRTRKGSYQTKVSLIVTGRVEARACLFRQFVCYYFYLGARR